MPNYPISAINEVTLPQFQDWTDQYGMMTDNAQGGTTGNGNLFTAHYVFGLYSNNILIDKEIARITQVFKNNFEQTGLLCRSPNFPGDLQAQDDMFGIMGAEALMHSDRNNRTLTKQMYEYGKKSCDGLVDNATPQDMWAFNALKWLTLGTRWVWNNVNPRKFKSSAWLGRFPNLIATMQMAQGENVNVFFWLYWAATMLQLVYFPGDKSYRDGYTLRFHSALACEGYGPLTNWVCRKVREAIARDYSDFGQLLGAYFAKPEHPIVALCKGKY